MRRLVYTLLLIAVAFSLLVLGGCEEQGTWVVVEQVKHPRMSSDPEGAYTITNEYDEAGNAIHRYKTSEDGSRSEWFYTYDEFGNIIEEYEALRNGEAPESPITTISNETDAQGRAVTKTVEQLSPNGDVSFSSAVTVTYNEEDKCSEVQSTQHRYGLMLEDGDDTRRFDQKGYLVELATSFVEKPSEELRQAWKDGTSNFFQDRCHESTFRYSIAMHYDNRGFPNGATLNYRRTLQLIESNGYGVDDEPQVDEGVVEYRFETDGHGNITKVYVKDSDMLIAEMSYKYIERPSVGCRAAGMVLPLEY